MYESVKRRTYPFLGDEVDKLKLDKWLFHNGPGPQKVESVLQKHLSPEPALELKETFATEVFSLKLAGEVYQAMSKEKPADTIGYQHFEICIEGVNFLVVVFYCADGATSSIDFDPLGGTGRPDIYWAEALDNILESPFFRESLRALLTNQERLTFGLPWFKSKIIELRDLLNQQLINRFQGELLGFIPSLAQAYPFGVMSMGFVLLPQAYRDLELMLSQIFSINQALSLTQIQDCGFGANLGMVFRTGDTVVGVEGVRKDGKTVNKAYLPPIDVGQEDMIRLQALNNLLTLPQGHPLEEYVFTRDQDTLRKLNLVLVGARHMRVGCLPFNPHSLVKHGTAISPLSVALLEPKIDLRLISDDDYKITFLDLLATLMTDGCACLLGLPEIDARFADIFRELNFTGDNVLPWLLSLIAVEPELVINFLYHFYSSGGVPLCASRGDDFAYLNMELGLTRAAKSKFDFTTTSKDLKKHVSR